MTEMLDGVSETALRIGAFVAIFAILAAVERLRPRRALTSARTRRWTTNLAIVGIDGVVTKGMAILAVPIAATAAAFYATSTGVGLFNSTDWPTWAEAAISIVALDFAIWLQHVATHKIPVLWRLHQVHHADTDIDVTTGIRFHPIEIALSVIWKVLWVLALGAPVVAVVLFEVILNAGAMFSHANITLPQKVDLALRTLIVTPDMHRVHHSVLRHEHDSNFGFNLSVWDRLFRTYRAQPEKGHENMTIGLSPYQSVEPSRLMWSLKLPFAAPPRAKEP